MIWMDVKNEQLKQFAFDFNEYLEFDFQDFCSLVDVRKFLDVGLLIFASRCEV